MNQGLRKGRVLVVDDQRNMRATTALLLRNGGYQVDEAAGGEEALHKLSQEHFDLLLTDLKMEPMDGLTLLARAHEASPHTQIMVMTAFGSIESAVAAMRQGACDYVTKPFPEGELLHRVGRALERVQLLSTVSLLAGELNRREGLALLGQSQAMKDLGTLIAKVAPTDATVLVQGESGTGKELVARSLHVQSRRRDRPFVPVNCAAITETLLESELFGHARGAFTGAVKARRGFFEEADGGTLFIDEVTETSGAFQSKLLRVLQEGEIRRVGESVAVQVNVRTVAATNRDLSLEVEEKRFRQDLYYRLNVVVLRVPPLRARLEDVPLLCEHFLSRANQRAQVPRRMTPAALTHLMGYDFPGNVRELENLVEQAVALAESEELSAEDFPVRAQRRSPQAAAAAGRELAPRPLADAVAEAEKAAILLALEKSDRDLSLVASWLQISPTTLWRKMKRLGLKTDGSAPSAAE